MADPFLLSEGGSGIAALAGKYLKADSLTSDFDIQMFDLSVNLLQAILWQYNDAENLQALLVAKQAWYNSNQQAFWQGWIANVFNLDTADEFGLGVWSIILGLPNFINQSSPGPEIPVFGFDGSGGVNFDNGILALPNGSSVVLSVATQRLVLQFRYFQLCSSGTVPETNRFLAFLFGGPHKAFHRSAEYDPDLPIQFSGQLGIGLRFQQSRYSPEASRRWKCMDRCDAQVFRV
jgi:hypothetical protein